MPIQKVIADGISPVKIWTEDIEETAMEQLRKLSQLPFIHKHIAVMPDVHAGCGSTIGSVIPTSGAVIPAAVGVDIGCGMNAIELSLKASDLPDSLQKVRTAIEETVPVGFGEHEHIPASIASAWTKMTEDYAKILAKYPNITPKKIDKPVKQLATLGGGNHFIELCLDERDHVWVMLHSGSRGIGNIIGTRFIQEAKSLMARYYINLPDANLSYLPEGTPEYDDYLFAMHWAQDYAKINRELMMERILKNIRPLFPPFQLGKLAINCHHNYAEVENHFGKNVLVTRKGAVRARVGDLGIIPGSMGAKSYIVEGLGNKDSFMSCSHGAGRIMSRTEAKRRFNKDDVKKQTEGVECRKDKDIVDEIPGAYKDIDVVMENQNDLVRVLHQLKQIVCVKG